MEVSDVNDIVLMMFFVDFVPNLIIHLMKMIKNVTLLMMSIPQLGR